MPQVSVVGMSAGQVVFAPHTEARWLTRDLVNNCGAAPPEVGQVGELEEDPTSWMFEVDPRWRVELCGLTAVGRPESMMFRVKGTKAEIDLTDHGVSPEMKNKAAAKLKFWRLVCSAPVAAAAPDQVRLHGNHSALGWAPSLRRPAGRVI